MHQYRLANVEGVDRMEVAADDFDEIVDSDNRCWSLRTRSVSNPFVRLYEITWGGGGDAEDTKTKL